MSESMHILEMIESGEISAEEGVRRLQTHAAPVILTQAPITKPVSGRRVWLAILLSGIVLTIGGGILIAGSYSWENGAGSALCGWPLLVAGLIGLFLGIWLQHTPWFSLRVSRHGQRPIAFALPLPLGPVAWIMRLVGPFIPQLKGIAVDDVILALRDELGRGQSFVVDVNAGPGGERVHVHFG